MSPRVIQIKHIFKIHEFRLLRRGGYSGWLLQKMLAELKDMKTLKCLIKVLSFKSIKVGLLLDPRLRSFYYLQSSTWTTARIIL
jgi:hypothetical protein